MVLLSHTVIPSLEISDRKMKDTNNNEPHQTVRTSRVIGTGPYWCLDYKVDIMVCLDMIGLGLASNALPPPSTILALAILSNAVCYRRG